MIHPPSASSPADVLAAVPYLLGFHPDNSIVAVALQDRRPVFAARANLPAPDTPAATVDGLAGYLAAVVHQQQPTSAIVIGYGTAEAAEPVLLRVQTALADRAVPIDLALRAEQRRYWTYPPDAPTGQPHDGSPFDPTSSPVAAHAVYTGAVALPDRAALVDRVAALTGPGRDAMRRATELAAARRAAEADREPAPTAAAVAAVAVRKAFRRYAAGGTLTDDEAATLSLLLQRRDVLNEAWRRTGDCEHDVRLWLDLTRRVQPDLAAPPASLLAFAAWRGGDGALARVAVDRAIAADPTYPMAVLLGQVLDAGLPPSVLDDWPDH
jgi:hypothetical protein